MEQDVDIEELTHPETTVTTGFIRAIEVWVPNAGGDELTLHNSDYTGLEAFGQISAETKFALGEGLPGNAWLQQRPVVLKQFDPATFKRTQAAHEAGLTSGVAIPIFDANQLKAVLVLLCGNASTATGAIEVWQDDGLSGMALVEGYYGDLERFEWLSKQIRFPQGIGLPGAVWQSQQAKIMADLANSTSFLRAANAKEAGIATGIGIPFYSPLNTEDVAAVLLFLSSKNTPLAARFEVWQQTDDGDGLWFVAGINQGQASAEGNDRSKVIPAASGVLGEALTAGIPIITKHGLPTQYQSMLAIPVHPIDHLKSVIVLYR